MPTRRSIPILALLPLAVLGCGSAIDATSTSSGDATGSSSSGTPMGAHPTWSEDVAPIVYKNCATCHVEGGIAPFALLTYENVSSMAKLIKDNTASRTMPPFNLDNTGDCNTYSDARWLTDAEIKTFADWADAGAPEGDASKAPAPPGPPAGLGDVSLTLDMGATYTPDKTLTDDYRCFVVDPGLAADQFLTGFEVKPGDARVVHHMIVFALDTDAADKAAAALDGADGKPGYTCFGGPGVAASRFVVGWAPGGGATHYAAGTGLRLSAEHKVVMQVHYNLANGAFPDRTKVDLALAPSVQKEAKILRVAAKGIMLPPGQALVTASGQLSIPATTSELTIWGVAPHMHTRGKTMDVTLDHAGAQSCVTKVSDWNFHWQSFSSYEAPMKVHGGDTLSVTCGYDTSMETTTITSGEGTGNEMCINFLYVTE